MRSEAAAYSAPFALPGPIPRASATQLWRIVGRVDGGPSFITDASGLWTVAITGPKDVADHERSKLVDRLVDCLNAVSDCR